MEGPVVERFWASELGNSAYLVADPDSGDAIVIDPLRDVDQYLLRAEALGAKVTMAVETHVHNDFISGARELEKLAGCKIGAAHDAGLEFDFEPLREGTEIRFGRFRLRVRHTPGHTPQHVSYVLAGEDDAERAIFSGGALMVGSIARTDLFGPHLATRLALEAYKTLHVRLRHLPGDTAVYPTHGGGSFCAAGVSGEATSTMRQERLSNPFLTTTDLMPFIARALHTGPYPAYYKEMAPMNRAGAPLAGRRLPALRQLTPGMIENLMRAGAAVVDTRPGSAYDRGHIPGSYNVGLEGPFSAWVGWLMEPTRQILLVADREADVREAQRQLFRIGFDNLGGQLEGGVEAWSSSGRPLTTFETAEVEDLASWVLSAEPMTVVDTRDEDEWVHGHVPGSVHLRVPDIPHHAHELSSEAPIAVHCGAGYRAAIAASLLEQAGFHRIIHVNAEYGDWDRMHLAATIPG